MLVCDECCDIRPSREHQYQEEGGFHASAREHQVDRSLERSLLITSSTIVDSLLNYYPDPDCREILTT